MTTKVLDTTDFDSSPADYNQRGLQAIAATPAVDHLLETREQEVVRERNLVFALISAVLLALGYGFMGAYQSIVREIEYPSTAVRAMAGGDLRARVVPSSNEAVGT